MTSPLPPPPGSLHVELTAHAPVGDEPPERALSIRSAARVLTGVLFGLTGLNVAAAISAPAVGPIALAAGLGSLTASRLKHGPGTLTVYDSFLVWNDQRHELAGVHRVSVSLTSTWDLARRHPLPGLRGQPASDPLGRPPPARGDPARAPAAGPHAPAGDVTPVSAGEAPASSPGGPPSRTSSGGVLE